MEYFIKSPCFEAFSANGKYYILTGSKQDTISNEVYFKNLISICNYCIKPKSLNEVKDFLQNHKINSNLLDYLLNNNAIIRNSIDLKDIHSRNDIYLEYQGIDSKSFRENLAKLKFLILGCGGIGNCMSYTLASLGAKELYLLDHDIIESSNLNRQFLFKSDDIGKLKVNVLKEALLSIHKDLKITSLDANIENYDVFHLEEFNISFIILSADSPKSLKIANEYSIKMQIPVLSICYLSDISCIGPFYIPGKSSCLLCNNIYADTESDSDSIMKGIKNNFTAPSAPMNNFLSSMMAINDIICYINNDYGKIKSLNKRYGVNSFTFETQYVDCLKNDECPYCSSI